MNISSKKTIHSCSLRRNTFLSLGASTFVSWILLIFFGLFSILGNGLHYWIPDSCGNGLHHFSATSSSFSPSIKYLTNLFGSFEKKVDFSFCSCSNNQDNDLKNGKNDPFRSHQRTRLTSDHKNVKAAFFSDVHHFVSHDNDCPVCHFCLINHGILAVDSDYLVDLWISAKTVLADNFSLAFFLSLYNARAP